MGGIKARDCIRAGKTAHLVILSQVAIDELVKGGYCSDLVKPCLLSRIGVGVSRNLYDCFALADSFFDTEQFWQLVNQATRIAYSTGPSGKAISELFAQQPNSDELLEKLVLAPVGVPVTDLIESAQAEIAFQQLSELKTGLKTAAVWPLPKAFALTSVFSCAIPTSTPDLSVSKLLLETWTSPDAVAIKQTYGFENRLGS